jgi:hypothetical protein
MTRERPLQERLLELFNYDPATGELRRRVASSRSRAGDVPGYIAKQGYRRIRVDGVKYHAADLIWVLMTGEWPPRQVDHIDTYGPKADWGDRWENLRLATNAENGRNRRVGTNNKSGHSGVFWWPRTGRWHANIKFGGRQIHLGIFADKEAAIAARRSAEANLFGEFRPTPHRANQEIGGMSAMVFEGGCFDRSGTAAPLRTKETADIDR